MILCAYIYTSVKRDERAYYRRTCRHEPAQVNQEHKSEEQGVHLFVFSTEDHAIHHSTGVIRLDPRRVTGSVPMAASDS